MGYDSKIFHRVCFYYRIFNQRVSYHWFHTSMTLSTHILSVSSVSRSNSFVTPRNHETVLQIIPIALQLGEQLRDGIMLSVLLSNRQNLKAIYNNVINRIFHGCVTLGENRIKTRKDATALTHTTCVKSNGVVSHDSLLCIFFAVTRSLRSPTGFQVVIQCAVWEGIPGIHQVGIQPARCHNV